MRGLEVEERKVPQIDGGRRVPQVLTSEEIRKDVYSTNVWRGLTKEIQGCII